MMPTLDELRHRRGFLTALERAVKGSARLGFDWDAQERFRTETLDSVRDPLIKGFIEGVFAQRLDRHPLRRFAAAQARSIDAIRVARCRGAYSDSTRAERS